MIGDLDAWDRAVSWFTAAAEVCEVAQLEYDLTPSTVTLAALTVASRVVFAASSAVFAMQGQESLSLRDGALAAADLPDREWWALVGRVLALSERTA